MRMNAKLFWVITVLSLLSTKTVWAQNEQWSSDFILPGVSMPNISNGINEAVIHDILYTEDNVFITGSFSTVEGILANNIARWDGNNWLPLGKGFRNIGVIGNAMGYGLYEKGDSLYVVGSFTNAGDITVNNIAVWDFISSQWNALNDGLDGAAFTIKGFGTSIIVGGEFENADNTGIAYAARWNGIDWTEIDGKTSFNGRVYTFESVNDSSFYVGGDFTSIGEDNFERIALFEKNEWVSIGETGADSTIYAIHYLGKDSLLVGGAFKKFDENEAKHLVFLDGGKWRNFNTQPDNTVFDIAGSYADFIIVGEFQNVGADSYNGVANFLKEELNTEIESINLNYNFSGAYTVEETDEGWIVGGTFDVLDNTAVGNLGFLDKESLVWDNFGSDFDFHGVNGQVRTIALDGNDVYIGGTFTTVGKKPISHLAKWDGETWEPMGVFNKSAIITDILVHGDSVYVTGVFTSLNKSPAANLAVYDVNTEQWSLPSLSINGPGITLAMYKDSLVVGGTFTEVAGFPTSNIATWHPKTDVWLGMESTFIASSVRDIEIAKDPSTPYYIGGSFSYGFTRRNYVASTWTNLGNVDGEVHSILATDSLVYFGGAFDSLFAAHPPEKPINIAAYDLSKAGAFIQFGDGLTGGGAVYALTSKGNNLIAGGSFNGSPASPVSRLGIWDGNTWSMLGNGISNSGNVYALAADDNNVYVGGTFTHVGGLSGGSVSNGFAIWGDASHSVSNEEEIIDIENFTLHQNYPNPFNPNTTISFSIKESGNISLEIFNVIGQKVATLIDAKLTSGNHRISFEASNLSSGIYIYRLQTMQGTVSKRMLLIK